MSDDEIQGDRPPATVWDAFEHDKQLNLGWETARSVAISLDSLIALIEQHPTAQAGALLESWRQRKTQPPDKRAG